jgi:hypothetical protein
MSKQRRHRKQRLARQLARANYYHVRAAEQFTTLQMDTISSEDAESLVDDICTFEFGSIYADPEQQRLGFDSLARLIAGIAAYEDDEYRQVCAERAIRKVFGYTDDGEKALSKYIAEVNQRRGGS